MTDRVRGRMLSAYGIQSKTIRIGDDRQKGYERAQFEPAWAAYLSDGAEDSNRDTVTIPENKGFPRLSNRDNGAVCHGSENAGNPMDKGIVTVSRFNRTGGRAGASPERITVATATARHDDRGRDLPESTRRRKGAGHARESDAGTERGTMP